MSSQTPVLTSKLPRSSHKGTRDVGTLPVTSNSLSESITVSPTDSAVSDYFDEAYDVFDTPAKMDEGEDTFGAGTPLTPPSTALEEREKPLTNSLFFESPLAHKAGGKNIFDVLQGRAVESAHEAKSDIKKESGDDVELGKIFRQMTAKLAEIAETNNQLSGSVSMSKEPDLTFRSYTKINRISDYIQPLTTATQVNQSKATQKPKVFDARTRNLLEEIIPHDIHEYLGEDPTKCIATLVEKRTRCKNNKNDSRAHKVKAADGLAQVCKNNEIEELEAKIQATIMTTMCGHHKNVALHKNRVEKLQNILALYQNSSSKDPKVAELRIWMSMLAKQRDSFNAMTENITTFPLKAKTIKADTPTKVLLDPVSTVKVESLENASTTLVSDYSSHNPNFQPYQPKKLKSQSVQQALRDLLQKPLSKTDLKPGHIYIYWYPGLFSKVKIGRSKEPEVRVKQWDEQCKRKHELHISSYNGELTPVPHVSRIERLMHVELKEVRLSVPKCEGCQRRHVEWFDLSERVAVRVFDKWSKWIASSPYEVDDSGNWVLTPRALAKLDEICEPVSLVEHVEKPAAQRGQKRKTVRRSRKSFQST